jgi:membrane protein YqaA with SNARE-associated domain
MPYTAVMRRAFATLLLLVFGASFVAPFVAAADPEANLPACCRAHGKHHCMMSAGMMRRMMAAQNDGTPKLVQIREKCPCTPMLGASASAASFLLPGSAEVIYASILAHPTLPAQTASKARISHSRSRQKRGPPALFL